jgi:hypothetical protein
MRMVSYLAPDCLAARLDASVEFIGAGLGR